MLRLQMPKQGMKKSTQEARERSRAVQLAKSPAGTPAWVVDTVADAEKLLALLFQQPLVSVDTETTGLDYMNDRVVVWSLSWGNRVFIHGDLLYVIKPWLESDRPKVFHNRKYDCHILMNHGIDVGGPCFDTMIMHWLLDENSRHGLKELVPHYLNRSRESYRSLFGKIPLRLILRRDVDGMVTFFGARLTIRDKKLGVTWKPNTSYKKLFLNATDNEAAARARFEILYEKLVQYATDDAQDTFELFNLLTEEMKSVAIGERNLWDYYKDIEEPFAKVLMHIERNGFCLDTDFLTEIDQIVDQEIQKVEFKFYQAAKQKIDLGSTKQLIKLFYHDLKFPVLKTTKGLYCRQCLRDATKATRMACKEHGTRYLVPRPSTDDDVLGMLVKRAKKKFALAGMLMEHRGLAKLQSTYIRGLAETVADDGRSRTSLRQHGTVTGRLASGDKSNGYPNLQNIPTHEKDLYGIRHAFIPPPGHGLIVLDYSQIELRLLAHFSQDPAMLEVYRIGGDLHADTAHRIWGADKTHDNWEGIRRWAKAVNFGIIYGMGPWKLASDIGVVKEEAIAFIDAYFKGYPDVAEFIRRTHYECRQTGYVTTIVGRRRRVLEIQSDDPKTYAHGKNQAVNSIFQGSAADVIKKSMLKVSEHRNPTVKAFGARLLLQVHDELIFECPFETIDRATEYIRQEMEHPFSRELLVPLKVSGKWGMTWGECK